MKNFKKLSRDEMKNALGGRSCTLTVRNANGTYTTYSGTCDTKIVSAGGMTGAGAEYGLPMTESFCNIGDGVSYPLTSNGGVSRC